MPTRPKKGTTVHLPSDVEAFLASRGARPDRGGSDRCWSQELAKNLNFLEAVLDSTNIRLDKSSQRAALDLIGEPWSWELEDLLLMEARFKLVSSLAETLKAYGLSSQPFLAAIAKLSLLERLRLLDLKKLELHLREGAAPPQAD
jgi:hypothetical protein